MPKYTIDLTHHDESRKLVFVRTSNESERHLALKLLAYLIFFDEQPQVEVAVGQHFKPDLVCVEGRDVTLWVDCGDITLHKLDKISTTNHRARIVVVKATQTIAARYKQQAERKVRRPERIRYIGFDAGFVDEFVAALTTRTRIVFQWAGDRTGTRVLHLHMNSLLLQTRVHEL